MTKVIIAGSRGFQDYQLLCSELDYALCFLDDVEIVSGTAIGADRLGERYAREHKMKIRQFPAHWSIFGKSAGFLRNQEMANYANACIVFWDGESKGTKHMIDLAKKNDLDLKIIMI